MPLSVVIPTYDRPQSLYKVLSAIASQGKHCHEVIVVDDGGPCPLQNEETTNKFHGVRYVYMEPKTEEWRAGMARNCGASLSTGERILFLDDDCQPRPGCLMVHDGYGPAPEAVAGRIEMVSSDNVGMRPDRRLRVGGPYSDVAKAYKMKQSHFYTKNFGAFWTGNMSVPAKEFKDLGGFWESIQGYGSEDQELAWRLRESGVKLKIDFRAVAYHFGPQHAQHKIDHRRQVLEASMQEPGLIREGAFLPAKYQAKTGAGIPSRMFNLEG
jgi:glycosyltransferase involved in cell wall biosynthesis